MRIHRFGGNDVVQPDQIEQSQPDARPQTCSGIRDESKIRPCRFGADLCPRPRPGRGGVQGHHRFREQGAGQRRRGDGDRCLRHAQVGWFDLARPAFTSTRCLACRMARCAAATSCRVQCGRRWRSRSTKQSSICGGKSALISGSRSSIFEREDRPLH